MKKDSGQAESGVESAIIAEPSITPGPWIVFVDKETRAVLAAGRPFEIALVTSPNRDKDADLIAAAPDLAAAGHQAWGALMWIMAYDSEDKLLDRARIALEAALQKAGIYDFEGMRGKLKAIRAEYEAKKER